ncbi:cyclic-phosphate processing receiver domain-containing protein [Cohnella silvisoli]|uniref:Cell division protein FtsJ n=1 Tax=Cohnella silvisoli TaxID=2873699 RepID=A0ABV1KQ26_9BACL|nr:cyclic-phosphate processing receiver domain-containing protein [Cohnella silvisoli]MCD9020995.1 cell division protein FtsJ [Cohnella silvisoli]
MINVYLDDVRPCPRGFVAARSAEECLLLLEASEVNFLSLDFELGLGEPNGLSVVHGIIAKGKYPREIFVHSSSLMGRAQMVHSLRAANPQGVVIHDGPMPPHILEAAAIGDSRNA